MVAGESEDVRRSPAIPPPSCSRCVSPRSRIRKTGRRIGRHSSGSCAARPRTTAWRRRYVRKDGSITWVNVNMTVIRDAAGQPTRTMATIEDITERTRMEAAIRYSEELHRSVVENIDAGIVLVDSNLYACCREPCAARIIGKPPAASWWERNVSANSRDERRFARTAAASRRWQPAGR